MSAGAEERTVRIVAPAKLNLGLEIVGRRPDGFHDLVTIFQAIDRFDDLSLSGNVGGRLEGDRGDVPDEENLAIRALARLRVAAGIDAGARVAIGKRIPVASGLGGASSDAAAALVAARALWNLALPDRTLARIALTLGSDVPFFLRGGTALAEGRGERLEPLPSPAGARFVVVVPRIAIPRKTAALYAALRPADFTDGTTVRAQADRLRAGRSLDPELLVNAFARPLAAVSSDLATLPDRLRRLGAPHVALSGAGPAHYVVLEDAEEARRLARTIRGALAGSAEVFEAGPLPHPPIPIVT